MTKKNFRKFSKNTRGRDFIASDVHGHYDELEALLQHVGFDPTKDRLFLAGDLVDRGPFSLRVLEWLAKPWVHAVLGNHDAMCISAGIDLQGRRRKHVDHGGAWFYELPSGTRAAIIHAFEMLPLAIEVEAQDGRRLGIVHAQCPFDDWDHFILEISHYSPELLRRSHIAEEAMWRVDRYNKTVVNLDVLFVGHTSLKSRQSLGNICYIDTGVCYPEQQGFLTLVDMNSNETYESRTLTPETP